MLQKRLALYLCLCLCAEFLAAQTIQNNLKTRQISFQNETIKAVLDYRRQANISLLSINGVEVIKAKTGIYSEIKTKEVVYSTLNLTKDPLVKIKGNSIFITDINYGDQQLGINESWTFTVDKHDIKLEIERSLSKAVVAEQIASPAILFNDINTWEGAFQDYGGLAWFYLFNKKLDTYGVHSKSARFWNSKTGNGLELRVDAPGNETAISYTRTADDALACRVANAAAEMTPRFDAGTNRRRFLRDTSANVWASVTLPQGKTKQSITFSGFDFNERFGRGKMTGINGEQVSAVLNTIARIGVIDKKHFGGNSWHTPYGPICLHEQYIAQMGLAINDPYYLKGYQDCLDFYRDNAIKPDGRVWPRWAYTNEDAMPGVFTDKGFYEAQWGYLLDSNPDLVINVVELYNQSGDLSWLKTHRQSCEKALDWIIKRDHDGNGLVEMMSDSLQQRRGSDWIDIIWASYENAFVNAKLYHALVLWSDVEKQLGNAEKATYYAQFAGKLKNTFNKPVSQGGFWDEANNCYVHWREKDGSIHGRNTVTPVNFMAIGYGICDDASRTKTILDHIETQMQKEGLFFWPLCMYTYAKGEGNDWQFPFPNYENGDLFLSWGALGVKAYAAYKPELALKYVKNVLAQYAKDGLAFQRYGRAKQDGLGDDILSGNSLSVVGLYQWIYGINPMYNRFYLDPHITNELSGTQLNYNFRDQKLSIDLAMNDYMVSNGQFAIKAKNDFGFFAGKNELSWFHGKREEASLKVSAAGQLTLDIKQWDAQQKSWSQVSKDTKSKKLVYQVYDLEPGTIYTLRINNEVARKIKSDGAGVLRFDVKTGKTIDDIRISVE